MIFYTIGGFISMFLYGIYTETIGKTETERDTQLYNIVMAFLMSWVFCIFMINEFCVNKIKTGTWFVPPKKNGNES
jgi:Na+/melibiose symporter-like transporter